MTAEFMWTMEAWESPPSRGYDAPLNLRKFFLPANLVEAFRPIRQTKPLRGSAGRVNPPQTVWANWDTGAVARVNLMQLMFA